MFLIGRGVPLDIYRRTNRLTPIDQNNVPHAEEAVAIYETTYNGTLTEEPRFGQDPLENSRDLCNQRDTIWHQQFKIDQIFYQVVNGSCNEFRNAILTFIEITRNLSNQ